MNHQISYLRVVASALCVAACVLLAVLWNRSYSECDELSFIDGNNYFTSVGSNSGTVYIYRSDLPIFPSHAYGRWVYYTGASTAPRPTFRWEPAVIPSLRGGSFVAPHWFVILLTAILAAAPWMRLRNTVLMVLAYLMLTIIGVVAYSLVTQG